MVRHHLIFCLAVAFASIVACGPDESTGDDGDVSLTDIDGGDAGSEAGADTDARGGDDAGDSGSPDAPDSRTDVDADGDAGPPPGSPVPVDFDAWLPEPGEGAVALFQIDDESQIPAGMSVQARVGDWMFDSGRSQWVVEGLDRTMSPCAFGGNVIDAIYLDPEGTPSEETVGEICLMANLGLTFAPSEFSVLEDGSEGRAVLAVNGRLEQLDFLNISAMAGGFLGGLSLELALEPSRVRPIGVTLYYALVPGSTALRVVTAVRNDGGEDEVLGLGHLVRPAGQGVFFNPLNNFGGYGYQSLGADSVSTTVVPFVAYTHETASWAYVPDPVEALARELPIGAGSATVAGVTATLLGNVDLLGTLLAPAPVLPTLPGILSLAPGESSVVGHHHVVGAGSLATTIDAIYPLLGVDTATVGGIVTDGGGAPVEGVRVTAVDTDGHGMNQSLSGADGSYAMHVPAGLTYEIRAYAPGRSGVAADTVTPTAAETLSVDVQTIDPGLLRVTVTDASGAPVVARLTVTCDGGCPRPLGAERDLVVDDIPGDFAALVHVGLDGVATVPLEPGDYGVVVSRGLEWSLWPGDATESGGAPVTIVSGETVALEAEIARVVDTVGALGGDFHVHALASSDSSVGNEDRVWNFVSDGLDVIVSTDHDFVIDYKPLRDAQELQPYLQVTSGVEMSSPKLTHSSSWPWEEKHDHSGHGAPHWHELTPKDLFELLEDLVLQQGQLCGTIFFDR